MKAENPLLDKSYALALRIVKTTQYLQQEKREFILSKQLLRSGTSIGANSEEAVGAQSKADFLAKLSIVYKEARETRYWLRLLRDSEFLTIPQAESLIDDTDEILKITGSIIKTLKQQLDEQNS